MSQDDDAPPDPSLDRQARVVRVAVQSAFVQTVVCKVSWRVAPFDDILRGKMHTLLLRRRANPKKDAHSPRVIHEGGNAVVLGAMAAGKGA